MEGSAVCSGRHAAVDACDGEILLGLFEGHALDARDGQVFHGLTAHRCQQFRCKTHFRTVVFCGRRLRDGQGRGREDGIGDVGELVRA
jgi:hypothetical protein